MMLSVEIPNASHREKDALAMGPIRSEIFKKSGERYLSLCMDKIAN